MKTPTVALFSLIATLAVGCQKNEELPSPEPAPSKVPAAETSTQPPANDFGAAAEQSMEKTVDTAAINNALQLFAVQEGRIPGSLDELVQKKYLAKLPTPPVGYRLEYDRDGGKVSVVKF